MKHLALAGLIILGGGTVGIAAAVAAEDPHHSHAEHAAPARKAPSAKQPAMAPAGAVKMNPVRQEMLSLSEAMNVIMLAVANNNLQAIPPAIQKVHGARMVTEKALLNGEYQPPKNGKDIAGFIKQDEAFHDELVTLMRAVKADDLKAATRQVGVIVNSCTDCHTQYRF